MIKRLLLFVLIGSWLFSFLDWKIIQFTRLGRPGLVEWMHDHEKQYAAVTRGLELVLCAPCLAFKPVFDDALLGVETSKEQQNVIVHAPRLSRDGFYHLVKRGDSWTFVSWREWFFYWTPIVLVWWLMVRDLFYSRSPWWWRKQ